MELKGLLRVFFFFLIAPWAASVQRRSILLQRTAQLYKDAHTNVFIQWSVSLLTSMLIVLQFKWSDNNDANPAWIYYFNVDVSIHTRVFKLWKCTELNDRLLPATIGWGQGPIRTVYQFTYSTPGTGSLMGVSYRKSKDETREVFF